MKPYHWLTHYFSCFCSYNFEFDIKYFRFNLVMWQNLYWLLFIKLLKHWIFVVFHPADTSNLLIKIRYPLSFVDQTDTLDLLISIGYSLLMYKFNCSRNSTNRLQYNVVQVRGRIHRELWLQKSIIYLN